MAGCSLLTVTERNSYTAWVFIENSNLSMVQGHLRVSIIMYCTSRWARHFARPLAACDLDIFHYITDYTHNMHAIQALIVNRAV